MSGLHVFVSDYLTLQEAQARKGCGKSAAKDVCQFRHAVAPTPCASFGDSTIRSDCRPPGKTRTHSTADAAGVPAASCHFDQHPLCVLFAKAGQFFFLDGQHEFDSFHEALKAGSFGAPLAVGARHFQAKRAEPFPVPLKNGGELSRRDGLTASSSLHCQRLTRLIGSGKHRRSPVVLQRRTWPAARDLHGKVGSFQFRTLLGQLPATAPALLPKELQCLIHSPCLFRLADAEALECLLEGHRCPGTTVMCQVMSTHGDGKRSSEQRVS